MAPTTDAVRVLLSPRQPASVRSVPEGTGSTRAWDAAQRAYGALDQVMADIQKELELNKAEETKTREVMEQLVRRRDSGGEPAGQSTSHGMVQVSKLDDLGLKNASLLSKMSAATAGEGLRAQKSPSPPPFGQVSGYLANPSAANRTSGTAVSQDAHSKSHPNRPGHPSESGAVSLQRQSNRSPAVSSSDGYSDYSDSADASQEARKSVGPQDITAESSHPPLFTKLRIPESSRSAPSHSTILSIHDQVGETGLSGLSNHARSMKGEHDAQALPYPAQRASQSPVECVSPASSTQTADDSQLPAGWEIKLDIPSGKVFYVNHAIRAISWERPPPDGEFEAQDRQKKTDNNANVNMGSLIYSHQHPPQHQTTGLKPTSRSAGMQLPLTAERLGAAQPRGLSDSVDGSALSMRSRGSVDMSGSLDGPAARGTSIWANVLSTPNGKHRQGANSDFLPSAGHPTPSRSGTMIDVSLIGISPYKANGTTSSGTTDTQARSRTLVSGPSVC